MALPPGIAGTKRPFDLPPASSVSNIDAIVVDDGISVRKATARQIVENSAPFATQGQAEAGVAEDVYMNPLRTAQAIGAMAVTPSALSSNAGALMVGTDDGRTVQEVLNASVTVPFSIGGYVNPPLKDGEILFAFAFPQKITFPADFSGSLATRLSLPTAQTVLTFLKLGSGDIFDPDNPAINTTDVGSLTYNTDGSFAFSTFDNLPVIFDVGDTIIPLGQAIADGTATYSFTLLGDR